jgi:hypothetical protein
VPARFRGLERVWDYVIRRRLRLDRFFALRQPLRRPKAVRPIEASPKRPVLLGLGTCAAARLSCTNPQGEEKICAKERIGEHYFSLYTSLGQNSSIFLLAAVFLSPRPIFYFFLTSPLHALRLFFQLGPDACCRRAFAGASRHGPRPSVKPLQPLPQAAREKRRREAFARHVGGRVRASELRTEKSRGSGARARRQFLWPFNPFQKARFLLLRCNKL